MRGFLLRQQAKLWFLLVSLLQSWGRTISTWIQSQDHRIGTIDKIIYRNPKRGSENGSEHVLQKNTLYTYKTVYGLEHEFLQIVFVRWIYKKRNMFVPNGEIPYGRTCGPKSDLLVSKLIVLVEVACSKCMASAGCGCGCWMVIFLFTSYSSFIKTLPRNNRSHWK